MLDHAKMIKRNNVKPGPGICFLKTIATYVRSGWRNNLTWRVVHNDTVSTFWTT